MARPIRKARPCRDWFPDEMPSGADPVQLFADGDQKRMMPDPEMDVCGRRRMMTYEDFPERRISELRFERRIGDSCG